MQVLPCVSQTACTLVYPYADIDQYNQYRQGCIRLIFGRNKYEGALTSVDMWSFCLARSNMSLFENSKVDGVMWYLDQKLLGVRFVEEGRF